jgi:hypothetical protein
MGLDAVIYDAQEEHELASKRLGNVSHIAFLREYAIHMLGTESLVVSKILYNGTHSGDSLAVSELQPLTSELLALEQTADRSAQTFARDMLELVHTASTLVRPIHFA